MKVDLLGLRLVGVVDNLGGSPSDRRRQEAERHGGHGAELSQLVPVRLEVDKLGVGLGDELGGKTKLLAQVNVNLRSISKNIFATVTYGRRKTLATAFPL